MDLENLKAVFREPKIVNEAQRFIDGFPNFIIEAESCFIKERVLKIWVWFEANFDWKVLDIKRLRFSIFIRDALNTELIDFRRVLIRKA